MSRFRKRGPAKRYCTSEDDDSDYGIPVQIPKRKSRGRAPRKAKKTAQKPKKRGTNAVNNSILSLGDSDVPDSEESYFKKIQTETLDNFFKSNKLISDSEDDDILGKKKDDSSKTSVVNVEPIVKDTNYYTITDSEDEVPLVVTTKKKAVPVDVDVMDVSKPCTSTTSNAESSILDVSEQLVSIDDIMADVEKIVPRLPDQNQNKDRESISHFMNDCDDLMTDIAKLIGKGKEPVEEKSPPKSAATCPVCLEELAGREPMATFCGHMFCKQCITAVIKSTNKKCPTCRKGVTLKKIHPLYL